MGSKFSIEQMTTQLSAWSRMTSSSNSFCPAIDRSMSTSLMGEASRPSAASRIRCLRVGGDAGARAAQDVAGPHHDREADRRPDGQGLVERVGEPRGRDGQADLLHGRLEPLAVLGGGDGLGVGPDDLDPVGLQHAPLGQGHGQVEGGLAAEGGQQGVGALALDDGGQHVGVEGLDVGPVGHARVGHDRGRVGVGQHHPEPLLGQHPAGLGARVVELAGLADHDGPGPDDQDRLEVVAAGHQAPPPSGSAAVGVHQLRNSSNR